MRRWWSWLGIAEDVNRLQNVRSLLLVAAGGLLSLVGSLSASGRSFEAILAALAGMLLLAVYALLNPEQRLFPRRERDEIKAAQVAIEPADGDD